MKHRQHRRDFLKGVAAATVAIPLLGNDRLLGRAPLEIPDQPLRLRFLPTGHVTVYGMQLDLEDDQGRRWSPHKFAPLWMIDGDTLQVEWNARWSYHDRVKHPEHDSPQSIA